MGGLRLFNCLPLLMLLLNFVSQAAATVSAPKSKVKRSENLLIVGLGNIGLEFEGTRHNIGFDFIDYSASVYGAPPFKDLLKFRTSYATTRVLERNIGLSKPNCQMNESGESVELIVRSLSLAPEDVLVITDDLNLTFGKVKLVDGSTSFSNTSRKLETTHNGLKSVTKRLSSAKYSRLLLGVGPKRGSASEFVLSKFSRAEQAALPNVYFDCLQALEMWLNG